MNTNEPYVYILTLRICLNLSYPTALEVNDISFLSQRRNNLYKSYFKKRLNSEHKLNSLIPDRREDLRNYILITYAMITILTN
jgi:hypothetical protein